MHISAIIHCLGASFPFLLLDSPALPLFFYCPSSVTRTIHSCSSFSLLWFPDLLHSAFVFHFCVYPSNMFQITNSDKAVDASLALAQMKLFILPSTPNLCTVLAPFGQISSIPVRPKASRKTCTGFSLCSAPSCCSSPPTIKPDLTVPLNGKKKKYTQISLFYKHLNPLYSVTC